MDDSHQQRLELARQCDAALKAGVPWEDLWRLIVEHPWYTTMLGKFAHYAVRRSRLQFDWEEDIVSVARDQLGIRLASDPFLGVAQASVHDRYLPKLRRTARDDCRKAVRKAEKSSTLRDASIDLNDLSADASTSGVSRADIRMDFETLLPQLSKQERMAVVLFDDGNGVPEIAIEMGLTPYKAEVVLYRGLARLRQLMSPPGEPDE